MTVTAKRSDTHHVPVVFFVPLHGEIAPPLDASYYKGCGERNGIEREIVVFGISPYGSNAMLSDNPNSGIYEAETSRTLDPKGGNPTCHQGGMIVLAAIEGNGSRPSHQGMGINDGKTMYTLNGTEVHGVVTFEPGILKREGGHYYENICGTLRANAGDNQMAVAYEETTNDS